MLPDPDTTAVHSVVLTTALDLKLQDHLLQHVRDGLRQEDIAIALWRPSKGKDRTSAVLFDILLPGPEDRTLDGNVTLRGSYLERCLNLAAQQQAGVAILHNHFTPGWQPMSIDDEDTERLRAPSVQSFTGLPLLGMTLGIDGTWSARAWNRRPKKMYTATWIQDVRVVGKALRISYHPRLRPAPEPREELTRAISVWGEAAQADVSRLHVGVIGVGSVGMMVVEGLARMGVNRVTLIDFDHVERHNLDRLLGTTAEDAENRTPKVAVAEKLFRRAATTKDPVVRAISASVVEPKGFEPALDCDLVFSCVDRPWPRQVLNFLAYAHLIPVIDGGVIVRMRRRKCVGVEWSVRTAGPHRQCLACAGSFNPSNVALERSGDLDSPRYLQGLDEDHLLRRNENTFAFSMALAAQELAHFVFLTTNLMKLNDLGNQRFHTKPQWFLSDSGACIDGCVYQTLLASTDHSLPRTRFLRY